MNGLSRDTGNTKGQSRMDYPETLVTLDTHDTGDEDKQKQQHRKLKG